MKKVKINCRFSNSIDNTGVELPYQGKLEETFRYSNADYNVENNKDVAGFNTVGYKMKYPDNDNTTIFSVDEGNQVIRKYLKISLNDDDKNNKYIGIHDDILIPLDTTYSKKGNFITEGAKNVATAIGKEIWRIVSVEAVQAIPYVGSKIAGLIAGGGTIIRQAAQIVWEHGDNYLPEPDDNVNERSIKLYKENEIPVMDKKVRSVDLVRRDDPNVPGDNNIVEDNEEPIWAGDTKATFDILEELEYTMTENNDTFTFDIDQYNSDPVVAAAPEGSPRPIGMKRVRIHTAIPPVIPEMDNENPVEIQSNGTYGIRYDDSSNELSIVPANQNRSVNNIGTFDVTVPSTPTQTKSVNYSSNGDYTVTPDSGYNLSEVNINVSVPSTPTQTKSVSYSSNGNYTVTPDTGYNLSQVNVKVNISGLRIVDHIFYTGTNERYSYKNGTYYSSIENVVVYRPRTVLVLTENTNYYLKYYLVRCNSSPSEGWNMHIPAGTRIVDSPNSLAWNFILEDSKNMNIKIMSTDPITSSNSEGTYFNIDLGVVKP